MEHIIAKELEIKSWQVKNAIELLKENTIHFVSRYRKDQTGGLNEIQLRKIEKRYKYLRNVEQLKIKILKILEKDGVLTPQLKKKIEHTFTLNELEDIYLPFKKRKKTKADIAIENGLLPLAEKSTKGTINLELVNEKEKIIEGITDILAQKFSHNDIVRKKLEIFLIKYGYVKCKKKVKKKTKYDMYDNFTKKLSLLHPHNILSINRGEKEGALKVKLYLPEKFKEDIFNLMNWNKNEIVEKGLKKGWKILFSSIEKRVRKILTEKAEERSIKVFSKNLKQLLLTPPLKNTRILAIDPGNKTGCKIVALDELGNPLEHAVIYPTAPYFDTKNSEKKILKMLQNHKLKLIVIGNGTASRETQQFIAKTIKKYNLKTKYIFSNEAGASVYSVSDIAIEEFPTLDPTIRSAISIGRRVQDPLAELVKIDPKSLGMGQYQHDINQKKLAEELKNAVTDIVNQLGIDLNSASSKLLEHVAGITPSLAKKIVNFRKKIGKFTERKQLLEIEGLGQKTYTQCAGFLRIKNGKNPLESTAIHPEHYKIANEILKNNIYDLDYLSKKFNVGILTLTDIINELKSMGKEDNLPTPIFYNEITDFKELKIGMKLKGKVINITDFGIFVDIGLKESGFIHKKLIDKEIKINDIIDVEVIDIDNDLRYIKLKSRR
ncbi:hypothetical protein SU69_01445 [Thermosipho melanesiensis]|uniref:RNA binding S1 domain protein n=2 Tax=Thermosipho melanesiensis TaxID=46541 RepID=A6LJP5_THEM4|nr:Tex-like N-terminal domain-containing protein [Thermosipho melanesiensis]ABR30146.1 RNA binding S1 domain protein [Thermosipho melanesiensis BI429]OOC38160.1 hypothetical protein SU68_01450 [Thermosipho melanesiensis]OOC40081.1 hypothetical protein SU70_01445 [Thermosipho melanesiensis]OOC40134.1 hypothetical protein SU69_01445 [Thermosipho melanesiensis]OOC44077.1 hypothetical protein SU71_01435 [Thermosipho melanesiensis]